MKYSIETERIQSTEIFFRDNQRFRTNFSGRRKKCRISRTKKIVKDLQLAYEKNLKLFKETKKNKKNKINKKLIGENKKRCSPRLTYCTARLAW